MRARWHCCAAFVATVTVTLLTFVCGWDSPPLFWCVAWLLLTVVLLCASQGGEQRALAEADGRARRRADAEDRQRQHAARNALARHRQQEKARFFEAALNEEARWRQNAKHGRFKAPGEEKEPDLR